MPAPLHLELTDQQRADLQRLRQRAHKAYLRERAAALLKVADGQSARQVAAHGLLTSHSHRTICEWVTRFQADGLHGLEIKAGRGRKPAFSPAAQIRPSRSRSLAALGGADA
jgi:transposase